jgi:hypothetical protein
MDLKKRFSIKFDLDLESVSLYKLKANLSSLYVNILLNIYSVSFLWEVGIKFVYHLVLRSFVSFLKKRRGTNSF